MNAPGVWPAETDRDRDVVRGLYPLYLHDLSEYSSHYRHDREGRWNPSYVDDFLARPLCTVFLIAAEDAAAGFVWVGGGDVPRRRPDADHRLAEFFVARPFRRAGIGRAAAHSVLAAKHGRWQLEVVEPNAPARPFWRRVLAERGTFREETGDGEVVFLFET